MPAIEIPANSDIHEGRIPLSAQRTTANPQPWVEMKFPAQRHNFLLDLTNPEIALTCRRQVAFLIFENLDGTDAERKPARVRICVSAVFYPGAGLALTDGSSSDC